jgi:methylenetetrahydrofolate reductase (NADPH)
MNEHVAASQTERHSLRSVLEKGNFAITAEINPPAATDPERLLRLARPLAGLADAVNVTDGASARTRMSSLAASAILARAGFEPIMQLTCRDRNRIGLQADVLGAVALGIRNFLVLRGDDPSAGDQPEAKPVFDLDSRQLLSTLAGIRDHRELPSGQKVEGPVDLFIGAADTPIDPPKEWTPQGLAAKADAGAQFVQTQFCMDAGVVRRYMARLAEHGLTERLSVLVGVAPLASVASARWIVDNLPGSLIPQAIIERMEKGADQKAEGRRICIELLQELAEIPGVAGAHIMAPLNQEAIPPVIEGSGLVTSRRWAMLET